MEQEIPFTLASARSPKGMWQIAKELGVENFPLACYNGALILANAEEEAVSLFSHPLNKADVKTVLDVLTTEFPNISVNLYSGVEWYVEAMDKWAELESDITTIQPIRKKFQEILAENLPVHKFLLIGETSEIEAALAHFQKLRLVESAFYLSKENYLEITHAKVSKETALREVAEYYQVPLEAVLTIGDNHNDSPMLKLAGLGVAMGNAPEAVKHSADVTTTTNNEEGVAKAIERYILNR